MSCCSVLSGFRRLCWGRSAERSACQAHGTCGRLCSAASSASESEKSSGSILRGGRLACRRGIMHLSRAVPSRWWAGQRIPQVTSDLALGFGHQSARSPCLDWETARAMLIRALKCIPSIILSSLRGPSDRCKGRGEGAFVCGSCWRAFVCWEGEAKG